jgi:hypothetical protein
MSTKTSSAFASVASSKSAESKTQKNLRHSKPPSYAPELIFIVVNMFLFKFYSERFFEAMSFFNMAIPMLIYLICTLFSNLMEFIKLLHIEDLTGETDDTQLISPKQQKLLVRVVRDLCAYFGIYYLSA